jgi:predicted esterase
MLLGCASLQAEEIIKQTYHYATNQGQELYLDRYMVDTPSSEPRPCMIFAFGGGFVRGERDHEYYKIYFDELAKAGIVVVSIDYRLGLSQLPTKRGAIAMIDVMENAVNIAVEDIYSATNFVIENAKEWGVDTSKIMLSGSSAGAITVLQAEWQRCNDTERSRVLPQEFKYAGIVSCAGAIFSTKGRPKFKSAPAPMLLFHGTSDSNVPYNHAAIFGIGFYGSEYITRQLDKLNSPYWFYSVEYADHRIAGTPLWDKCDLILQFIRDYVIGGEALRIRTDVENINGEKRPTRFKVKDYLKTNYKRDLI